jgi:hypothetical protein
MTRRVPPPRLLGPESDLPLDRRLAAIEDEDAWYVIVEGRDGDWLARFEKTAAFDARDWAMSMVRTFNARLRGRAHDPHPATRDA